MDGYLEARREAKREEEIIDSVNHFIAQDMKKETSSEVSSK